MLGVGWESYLLFFFVQVGAQYKEQALSLLNPKELMTISWPLQSQTQDPASLPRSPVFMVPPPSFTAKRWNKLMFLYYLYTSHISESIKQSRNLWNKNAYSWKKFFSFWKRGQIHVLFGDSQCVFQLGRFIWSLLSFCCLLLNKLLEQKRKQVKNLIAFPPTSPPTPRPACGL